MIFLLLFFDMNNIYTFSGWWYFWALVLCDAPLTLSLNRAY